MPSRSVLEQPTVPYYLDSKECYGRGSLPRRCFSDAEGPRQSSEIWNFIFRLPGAMAPHLMYLYMNTY